MLLIFFISKHACRDFIIREHKLPCNEKNLAFLAVLVGDEIKIKDGIAALIGRQRLGEILIGFIWVSELLHNNRLVLNLENNETVVPLRF